MGLREGDEVLGYEEHGKSWYLEGQCFHLSSAASFSLLVWEGKTVGKKENWCCACIIVFEKRVEVLYIYCIFKHYITA